MPPQLAQVLFALKKGEPTMVETPRRLHRRGAGRDRRGRSEGRSGRLRSGARGGGAVDRRRPRHRLRRCIARARRAAHQSAGPRQRHWSASNERHRPAWLCRFRSAYDAGRGTLVWRRGVADLETPVAAFLKLAHGRPNSFLLESVEGGAARGRYSIIGMEPDLIWRCRDGRAEVNRYAQSAPHAFVRGDAAGAGQPARADRRDAAGRAGEPAADGGRAGRLSRLRHGAADGDVCR